MGDTSCVLSFPWFPLPEDIGGVDVVRDFSGHGNHGTPANFTGDDSEFVQNNSWGQSLSLPGGGADKHLDCGNDDSINTIPLLTVECILSMNALAPAQDIISKFNVAGNLTYLLVLTGASNIWFYTGGALDANAAPSGGFVVPVNNALYIVGRHDGINTSLFLNGLFISNALAPLTPVASTTNLLVGIRANGANDANAVLHSTRIWNRAMGAAEILNRYKNRHRLTD